MEKVIAIAALSSLCACGNIGRLTSEDIYGLSSSPRVWVYGQVTNSITGAPLSGVAVQIEGESTSTDRNGAYSLEGLDAADVLGSASVHGFRPHTMMLTLKAGANANDITLVPQECGRSDCGSDQFCFGGACVTGATLTGAVVNGCDGTALDARVTIDGKSSCSTIAAGKAYFQLTGLTPGGPHVLAIGRKGWLPSTSQVTLQPGFNVFDTVSLFPPGGCSTLPADVPCTCTDATCQ